MKLLVFFIASVTNVFITTTASPMHSSWHKKIPVNSFTEDHYGFLRAMRDNNTTEMNRFLAWLAPNQTELESFFKAQDRKGNTILHCASGCDCRPNNMHNIAVTNHLAVSIILTYLQSPLLTQILTTTNNDYETPLDIALKKNHEQTFVLLAQKAYRLRGPAYLESWLTESFALHWAARHSNNQLINQILAVAEACDPSGGLTRELLLMKQPNTSGTPLHCAITELNHNSISAILEAAYKLRGAILIRELFTVKNLQDKIIFDCASQDGKIRALLTEYFDAAMKPHPLDPSPLYFDAAMKPHPLDPSPLYFEEAIKARPLNPFSLNSQGDPLYNGSPSSNNKCLFNRCVGSPNNQGSNYSSPFSPFGDAQAQDS